MYIYNFRIPFFTTVTLHKGTILTDNLMNTVALFLLFIVEATI